MTPIEAKALEETANTAKTFFGKILGPMADELGQQLADNIRTRRLKNQLKNLEKVRAIVQKEGITMKEINFKAMFPLLEGMALEENESLQDMWANLFTNYIDSSKHLITHVYPDILRQLSSEEVIILKNMQGNNGEASIDKKNLFAVPFGFKVEKEKITNLERLGIVAGVPIIKTNESGVGMGLMSVEKLRWEDTIKQSEPDTYVITDFGRQFLKACTR